MAIGTVTNPELKSENKKKIILNIPLKLIKN